MNSERTLKGVYPEQLDSDNVGGVDDGKDLVSGPVNWLTDRHLPGDVSFTLTDDPPFRVNAGNQEQPINTDESADSLGAITRMLGLGAGSASPDAELHSVDPGLAFLAEGVESVLATRRAEKAKELERAKQYQEQQEEYQVQQEKEEKERREREEKFEKEVSGLCAVFGLDSMVIESAQSYERDSTIAETMVKALELTHFPDEKLKRNPGELTEAIRNSNLTAATLHEVIDGMTVNYVHSRTDFAGNLSQRWLAFLTRYVAENDNRISEARTASKIAFNNIDRVKGQIALKVKEVKGIIGASDFNGNDLELIWQESTRRVSYLHRLMNGLAEPNDLVIYLAAVWRDGIQKQTDKSFLTVEKEVPISDSRGRKIKIELRYELKSDSGKLVREPVFKVQVDTTAFNRWEEVIEEKGGGLQRIWNAVRGRKPKQKIILRESRDAWNVSSRTIRGDDIAGQFVRFLADYKRSYAQPSEYAI